MKRRPFRRFAFFLPLFAAFSFVPAASASVRADDDDFNAAAPPPVASPREEFADSRPAPNSPSPNERRRRRVVLRAAAPNSPENAAPSAPFSAPEPQIFVGREIADYRTADGAGRYALEDDLGEIRVFDAAQIESIEPEPEIDADELRSKIATQLLQEFGPGFDMKSTERYLFVYNVSEGYAEWCARLFESLADGFEKFAEKNSLEPTERSEPMIVVIFATRQEFNRYAAKETPDPSRLAAYYNMQTNRVVLRDLSGVEAARDASESGDDAPPSRRQTYREIKEILSRPNAEFNVATIVHEATHQIAFNRGVFLRTGPFPLWAVEGLSLLFETPNGRATQGGWSYRGVFPKNERQLALFRAFAARSTTGDPLRDLIRQDKFMNDVQGSYSTSWALFYYLYKRKPRDLARYVQKISEKPPYVQYPPEERVADFEEIFGDDWEKLYKNLGRFIRSL